MLHLIPYRQIYDPKEAKKAVIALRLTRARVKDTNRERVKKATNLTGVLESAGQSRYFSGHRLEARANFCVDTHFK